MRKRGLMFYMFASFFGAAMIAGSYAYYNYKFSQFNFIDFEKIIFYTKQDIFIPNEEKYLVLFYSSKKTTLKKINEKVTSKYKILAIDFHQKREQSNDNMVFLTAGIDKILKLVHKFKIYNLPSLVTFKRINGSLYKQDSHVYIAF